MNEEYKSRVAVYLRKSRNDDPNETIEQTLERHMNQLTDFALKNNINIIKTYKEVVSGDGLFTRPQMVKLLNDIEQGLYTAVLCMDIDRLGRSSTKDSGIILEVLQDNNCRIINPDKTYNLNDDVDEMTVEMKTFFARQELKSIKKRLRRGQEEVLKAGGHTGEPPYAYKRIWLDKTPSLEPIPEKAEIVKHIYDLYVNEHYGSYIIADKLNTMGIPAPDGGLWSRTSVRMIVSNPIYAGLIVWNKTKSPKKKRPEDKYKKVINPPELWIEAKGLHEPLVSIEMWDEAQRIRSERSHPPSFTGKVKNPFSGLVYCANCGMALQRQVERKTKVPRLLCPTSACMPSIKMCLFEDQLKIKMQDELDRLRMLENRPKDNAKQAHFENQIKALNKQLTTISRQRDNLHDLLEQGVYDVDTFMQRQTVLIEKQNQIEKEMKELHTKLRGAAAKITIQDAILGIEEVLKEWDNLDPVELNSLLKRLISRITYKRESRNFANTEFEIEIEWRL